MSKSTIPQVSRRRLMFAGAGSAGALAAAAAVGPVVRGRALASSAGDTDAPEPKDGYQVTQHVLRYYQTAKV
jgi:nucleoside phosphorylase